MYKVEWGWYDGEEGCEEYDDYEDAYATFCDLYHEDVDYFMLYKLKKDKDSGDYFWKTLRYWDKIEHYECFR